MLENSHTQVLIEEAQRACLHFDWRKTIPPNRIPSYFARLANRFFKKRGYTVQDRPYLQNVQTMLSHPRTHQRMIESSIMIQRFPERFDATYALLADDESRATFDWYIRHRVTASHLYGYADEVFPSPVTKSKFTKMMKKQKDTAVATGFSQLSLAMLALGQYSLPEHEAIIQKGDVVIDVGGCSGDTVWHFRQQAGDDGKIYVFEPISTQFTAIKKMCKEKGWDNVEAFPYGLWNEQTTTKISVAGACSSITTNHEGLPTETIALMPLDVIVREQNWNQIDFIKMDIEGAEQNALLGCREAIERFAPKLAISIYHLADDMVRIPQIINKMQVNYRFHLRHYSTYSGETVLYAVPQ